jgi:hypothetical protein
MIARRFLLAAALSAAAMISPAMGQSGTIRMVNTTSVYLTLSINGLYGCNTAPGTTCTVPWAAGSYQLSACASDGRCIYQPITLESGGTWTWTIYEN